MNPQTAVTESRQLQSKRRWLEAERPIREALAAHPNHPELCLELAMLRCFAAAEDEALRLLPHARTAEGGARLVEILAAHYKCRKLAARALGINDPVAEDGWRAARAAAEAIGISIEDLPGIRLTACLIAKNEEKHIEPCLRSLNGLVDEIVVVDTGSTDRTAQIAESLGAKVGVFEWCDDFALARNASLELATGDWILWIDADERLDVDSKTSLISGLVRPHFGGYTIQILNFLNESEQIDQIIHRPCRLFRKLPGVQFEGRVHEQVAPSIERLGLPVARLEGVRLKHYGYRREERKAKGKDERNIRLIERELEENPDDGFQLFNLANSHFTIGNWSQAAENCERASKTLAPGIYHGQFCYQLWATSLHMLGKNEAALSVCAAAQDAGFGGPLVEFARAIALKALQRYDEAIECCRLAKSLQLDDSETGDRSISAYKARFLAAQIYEELGDWTSAAREFESVWQTVPEFLAARLGLANALRHLGEFDEALEHAKAAMSSPDVAATAAHVAKLCAAQLGNPHEIVRIQEALWRTDVNDEALWAQWALAAEQAEDWPTVARAYAEYLSRFEPTAPAMINAGRALAHVGKHRDALECFEEAARLDPQDANVYFNIGDLMYRCGNFADSAISYKAGLTLDPSNAEGWFTLGNALFQLSKHEAAQVAYEQAIRIRPDHHRAEANLSALKSEMLRLAS